MERLFQLRGWLVRKFGPRIRALGWYLRRSGRSNTAEAALEQALIAGYGCLGKAGNRSC